MEHAIDEIISGLVSLIGNNLWVSAGVAFLAGMISSLSPCLMTTVPLMVGYIGRRRGKGGTLLCTLLFSLGVVVTFCLFGMAFILLETTFSQMGNWWNLVVAVLLVVVALDLMDLVHILHRHDDHGCSCTVPTKYARNHDHDHDHNHDHDHEHDHHHTHRLPKPPKAGGYPGAFLWGLFGGVFTAPCALPAIAALLAFGRVNLGLMGNVVLLVSYAVGHTTLITLSGLGAGFVNKLSQSEKTANIGRIFRMCFGVLLLLCALYIAAEGLLGHTH